MFHNLATALLVAAVSGSAADYTTNGADWTGLCANGVEQSPIELNKGMAVESGKMEVVGFNYYDFKVGSAAFDASDVTWSTLFDNESLRKKAELQLTFADGSQSYFQPNNFHFHSPSEHTVNGARYDLEVHFVHMVRGSDNVSSVVPQDEMAGAVIGIFFDVQDGGDFDNAFLDSLFNGVTT